MSYLTREREYPFNYEGSLIPGGNQTELLRRADRGEKAYCYLAAWARGNGGFGEEKDVANGAKPLSLGVGGETDVKGT